MSRDEGDVWHHDGVPSSSRRTSPDRLTRPSGIVLMLVVLAGSLLLTGCLERSTTVGDRLSGSIIVATDPDNPRGAPQLDVPQSMAGRISVNEFTREPDPDADPEAAAENAAPGPAVLTGTRATFSDLTPGQFNQLGDIIGAAFDDSSMTMDLNATRTGDVVRVRGTADLADLLEARDFLQVTVSFEGQVTATNVDQIARNTVIWTPVPGVASDFNAETNYPDPATAAVGSWSWFFGFVCLAVVALVGVLAYRHRDNSPRPGRPIRA